jgi:hypothetical protein
MRCMPVESSVSEAFYFSSWGILMFRKNSQTNIFVQQKIFELIFLLKNFMTMQTIFLSTQSKKWLLLSNTNFTFGLLNFSYAISFPGVSRMDR